MDKTPKKKKKTGTLKKKEDLNSTRKSTLNDSGSVSSLNSTSSNSSRSNYNSGTYKLPKFTSQIDEEKKKEKRKEFDISSVKTESELNRAVAELTRQKNDAIQERDFPAANTAQENIDKLNKKLEDSKKRAIEKSHAERLNQLDQLKAEERENLDNVWKENFRKHEETAQQLRDEMETIQKGKRREIENEATNIFHPSREYLDIDRKMHAMTKAGNFQGANGLLKDLKEMEIQERAQWDSKEQGKTDLKLAQFDAKAATEKQDLEARVAEDRIIMERTQARSYQELESKFLTLYQMEDETYNNEKQKLMKKLI